MKTALAETRDRGRRALTAATLGMFLSAVTLEGAACTVDAAYEEAGPKSVMLAAMMTTRILTGKDLKDLDSEKQQALLTSLLLKPGASGVTKVITSYGDVVDPQHLLRETSLPSGCHTIYGAEESGNDMIRVRVSGKQVWLEESYGCYGLYGYDRLQWNGYGGSLCSTDEMDALGTVGCCS